MPFDPDQYLASKPGFDPDAYLAERTEKPLPAGLEPSDTVDSSIRGGLNALTGGHMPQIAGAVEHPVGALRTLLAGGTGHDVSEDPDVKAYSQTRDQYKNLYDQAWKDHPVAYATGYAPGLAVSPLNKLGPLAAAGTFAEGASNADLTKGEIGQDVYDASKGVIGAKLASPLIDRGSSAVANYIGNKLGGLGNSLGGVAEDAAALHLGSDADRGVGRLFLNEGEISPFEKSTNPDISGKNFGADAGLTGAALFHPNPLTIGAAVTKAAMKGRGASTAAVGIDALSKVLQSAPEKLGSYANVLQQSAAKGAQSLAITHFLLGQKDPKYQATVNEAVNGTGEQ